MVRECVYCGTEYIDDEKYCECGGMIKMRKNSNEDEFVYMVDGDRYNNIDNILESKRNKGCR